MKIKADTVEAYLAALPDERRAMVEAIRAVILAHIDTPFAEGIQHGMIGYYLPHEVYPAGYHVDPRQPLPFAAIGVQKHHVGLYLFCVYVDAGTLAWFTDAWRASGKRLDMGKACVRVKRLDGVPLEVLGELFARVKADDFVRHYEGALPAGRRTGKRR